MIEPRRLGTVVLGVRDLDASLTWYRQKFGFEKLYDDAPNSNGIAIGKGGVEIHLNPLPKPDQATPVATDRQVCIQLFCLEVDPSDPAHAGQVHHRHARPHRSSTTSTVATR